ncbi:MAG: Npt1/Npt2 family nucleotide transporter [Zetaproteobacteria bacterium]|nr:Npt1/Npt2 family nucleotide transporter [Zetaproteobacteria bacterium]
MNKKQSWIHKIQDWVLPIHKHEVPQICSLLALLFLIAFNYNFLKLAKDSVVIPALRDSVVFVKMWFLMPMAVLMTAFFSYLNEKYKDYYTFLIIIGAFFLFFLTFGLIIYPNQELFTPKAFVECMEQVVPQNWSGLCDTVRALPLTIFYVMCELWSTTVWFVLFWGYVNRITSFEQAKRFFPLIALAGNTTGVFAPLAYNWAAGNHQRLMPNYFVSNWYYSVALICMIFCIVCLLITALFVYMNAKVFPEFKSLPPQVQPKQSKPKVGFVKKISFLVEDRSARAIAIIVLSYNIIINLSEMQWKSQLSRLYATNAEYGIYFGKVMTWTAIIAVITDLFFCSKVLRVFGWKFSAKITPWVCILTSIGFFGFLIADHYGSSLWLHSLPWSPLAIAVFFGSMQNTLVRASKYSFFDPTKEMAYIPLSEKTKATAKAAIDGVGSRLGKSGGSSIYQILYLFVGNSLAACAPFVGVIIFLLSWVWLRSIQHIAQEMGHQALPTKNQEHQAYSTSETAKGENSPSLKESTAGA